MKNLTLRLADRLNPGSFSFVMATGIVSIDVFLRHQQTLSYLLFDINKAAYAVLIVLTVIRAARQPRRVLRETTAPAVAPSVFTITAGTCILASQYVLLSGSVKAGMLLWMFGLLLWAVLLYAFFAGLVVAGDKASFETELNGGWLIYVVGTQGAAISTIFVGAGLNVKEDYFLLLAAVLHAIGSILYAVLIVPLLRRMMFLPVSPALLTQRYWITMGAAAISTLAGAELIIHAGTSHFLKQMLPALTWTTFLFWATATWWIPLVVVLVAWRYGYRRFPLTYDVQHWSMVFPLGMYAVSSFELGQAMDVAFFDAYSRFLMYPAFMAWTITFLSMIWTWIGKRGPGNGGERKGVS